MRRSTEKILEECRVGTPACLWAKEKKPLERDIEGTEGKEST